MNFLPISHLAMMIFGWLLLAFNRALVWDVRQMDSGKRRVALSLRPGSKRIILFSILMLCCVRWGALNFIGCLAIFGSILLLTCGSGDARYVAKKFAAYHFFALILCACAEISPGNAIILRAVAFAILTAAYPLNSWLDSFFIRGSGFYITTWLIIVRPIVIGFFLATVGPELRSLAGEVSKLFPMVLVWGSLGFVPILFFSKSEIRRLISRMACWQSGYIWLFALYFPEKILNSVSLFAISQGIFIAIIFQSAVSLCGADDLDFVESVGGTFEKNYFPAIFLGSSLMLLVAMPAVFMCKRNMPSMQSALVYQVIGSVVLPIVFSFRVHWSMRGGSGAKC